MSEKMTLKVAIVGYSGHAYVVLDTLEKLGAEVVGYFELRVPVSDPYELEYLGKDEIRRIQNLPAAVKVMPTVGDNAVRRRILASMDTTRVSPPVVDPTAVLSQRSNIGIGSFVAAHSSIGPMASIGIGAIINTAAIVEHDCRVEDYCHIAPGAVLAGGVEIGEESFVGANAVLREGVRVGRQCTIGAGSVVVSDCEDGLVYVGSPAKPIVRRNSQ